MELGVVIIFNFYKNTSIYRDLKCRRNNLWDVGYYSISISQHKNHSYIFVQISIDESKRFYICEKWVNIRLSFY